MKHSIISQNNVNSHNKIVSVRLLPDNDTEKNAIYKLQKITASDSERELVENYLHFSLGLGNYSIVKFIKQTDNLFVLEVFV